MWPNFYSATFVTCKFKIKSHPDLSKLKFNVTFDPDYLPEKVIYLAKLLKLDIIYDN